VICKILLALCMLLGCSLTYASDRFNPALLKSVLRIETPPGANGFPDVGGGFLVLGTEDTSGKIYLVTNKHMLGDWNYADANIEVYRPWINVFFYRASDPSGKSYRPTKVELLSGSSLNAKVHLHPSPLVDLALIDVTDEVRSPNEHIDYTAYAPSFLLPFAKIQDWQTDIADQVIALGYPLGIRSLRNNYPIVKMGYLASMPGEEVSIPSRILNRAGLPVDVSVDGKFLIVDGLIVGGNSGGPVVLVGGGRFRLAEIGNTGKYTQEFLDQPVKNYVIGVVSLGLGGGLTAVVSADYLLDLLHAVSDPH
jgi:hypothetical protein